jgi:hypothetical protein
MIVVTAVVVDQQTQRRRAGVEVRARG